MNQVHVNVILTIIAKHNNYDPMLPGYKVAMSNLMFTYGADDEFRAMIDEIEDTFGVLLDEKLPDYAGLGEMSVQAFINEVLAAIEEAA